uniref:Uncharacterized protein n=1 Tax=Arundo donax TaxID=35708 RepID=A0A0A9D0T3_ARUDO
MPLSAPEIQAAAELVGGSEANEVEKRQRETAAASAGGECSGASPDLTTIPARPLPLRCPPCPKNGTRKNMRAWNLECRRISRLVAEGHLLAPLLATMQNETRVSL